MVCSPSPDILTYTYTCMYIFLLPQCHEGQAFFSLLSNKTDNYYSNYPGTGCQMYKYTRAGYQTQFCQVTWRTESEGGLIDQLNERVVATALRVHEPSIIISPIINGHR